ncbi:hypothetical protein EJD97_002733 [Solanum chilense]|uniref:Uncharacterized protein n=1 Tax=Solanum chilense TaxID=4083 RepID=A0A6N2BYA4_SOLCI|nr:hypothetical protein EJD97_002733 [Solanum chilense]
MVEAITDEANFGDDGTQRVRTHGTSSKEDDSQGKNIHLTDISNHLNRGIITSDNPAPFTDPKSNSQQAKHESEGEASVAARNDEYGIIV